MKFIVIGITDNRNQYFTTEVLELIRRGHFFSGGKRHHELVRHLLPRDYEWIDVTAPLSQVFEAYRRTFLMSNVSTPLPMWEGLGGEAFGQNHVIIVFASGDPLFYGYATTLQREFPDAEMQVFPTFNSLQLLSHRCLLPYQDMRCVSVTGRPWKGLDDALIRGEALVGCLTDKYKTPKQIANRMLEYGFTQYRMLIGECLGNPHTERVGSYDLSEVPETVLQPNCIILQQTHPRPSFFGIPDSEFHLLDGRVNMITKAPLRLITLSALGLSSRQTLWDVGFCTGSVSIEARLRFPHLCIEAFEIRPEGEELMRLNSRKFGAPGIGVHIGDFLQTSLDDLPRPDAVFIGGHGGKLKQMVERIRKYLLPGGIIVFNSVSDNSRQAFLESVGACEEMHITLDQHNPITVMSWKQP